jgi:hypothetical protein
MPPPPTVAEVATNLESGLRSMVGTVVSGRGKTELLVPVDVVAPSGEANRGAGRAGE